jgi:hypothetical protein
MSSEGFKNVPGVPEGWELVRFDYAVEGERYLTGTGEIVVHLSTKPTLAKRLIIRKIETPKKYRPFANAEEFKPHRDRWVEVVSEDDNCGCYLEQEDIGGKRKIDGYNEDSVCIWEGWMTYGEAFECFTFDDGTPFGVEVAE